MRDSKTDDTTTERLTSDSVLVAPQTRKRRERDPIKPGQQLLFKGQLVELLGSTYSAIHTWMQDEDIRFPLPIALGPADGRSTKIAWFADEVHAWIKSRPRRAVGQRSGRYTREPEQVEPRPVRR